MTLTALLSSFPRYTLLQGPTPLHSLTRFEDAIRAQMGQCPNLYIKRDDMTGLAGGGNKARKLEFLIGEALAQGADTIVTAGALQSNHARQTAAAAANAGLKCTLLLFDTVPHKEPAYRCSGNLLLDHLLGADVRIAPEGVDAVEFFGSTLRELSDAGGTPYVIPVGGSNCIGSLGYVAAFDEISQQAGAMGLSFDRIVHGSSSFGTQAGLTMGAQLLSSPTKITGINVYKPQTEKVIAELNTHISDLATHLKVSPPSHHNAELVGGFLGKGYGVPTPEMHSAVELLAQTEGILLDPVYTGKAVAGLLALIGDGRIAADETVLFLHTGGYPGLFAYVDALSEKRK